MLKFENAIVRKPSKSMLDGITTGMFSDETPIYEDALKQHATYVSLLKQLGLDVLELDPLEQYPDSCFVEDPAVVMKECAIITNSSADSRNGEKKEILPAIQQFYKDEDIYFIEAPGTMEGGDVMLVDRHFFIGCSNRTNMEGIQQFENIVSQYGYTVSAVEVKEGLHLKDFVIYLENNNMLLSETMNEVDDFAKYNRYIVPKEELYAINSLYINGTVLVPKGNPNTEAYIRFLGYPVIVIDTDEFKKIDGSLTCLSLRF